MKVLVIRFSSLGDIMQGLAIPTLLREFYPEAEIHWVTRSDYAGLIKQQQDIAQVFALDRSKGLDGLWLLAQSLREQKYTHIYDAHNNLRSFLLSTYLRFHSPRIQFLRRPKNRWKRFLLFQFHLHLLPQPFRGQMSYLEPLRKWHVPVAVPNQIPWKLKTSLNSARLPENYVALVPSAAWPLKRWPVNHWRQLVQNLKDVEFVVLGGAEDTFCAEIQKAAPERVINLAGALSFEQSCRVVENAKLTIANDTGLMHASDILGKPTIALIGPTAFGYPSHPNSRTLEIQLKCKPCSKDGRNACRNPVQQQCMQAITVDAVAAEVQRVLRD